MLHPKRPFSCRLLGALSDFLEDLALQEAQHREAGQSEEEIQAWRHAQAGSLRMVNMNQAQICRFCSVVCYFGSFCDVGWWAASFCVIGAREAKDGYSMLQLCRIRLRILGSEAQILFRPVALFQQDPALSGVRPG